MNNHVKKYKAAICATAKDEDRYICEWIAYHLALGFDHVFLYDNLSVRPVASLIRKSVLLDKVTVIRWPSHPGESAQLLAYRHFLSTYRDWVEWAAVLDLDEFLHLKKDASISEFIGRFPTASGISINWRIFGSSNELRYSRKTMIERFQHASDTSFDANVLVKSMHRLSDTLAIKIHYGEYVDNASVMSPGGSVMIAGNHSKQDPTNYDIAQINHYFVKSREEWIVKNIRGYPDDTIRPPEMFDLYDRNEVEDRSILVRLPAVRAMMRRVRRPKGLLNRLTALRIFKVVELVKAWRMGKSKR